MLWATHLIDEVRSDDDIVVLARGEIAARGRVDDVVRAADAPDLETAFGRLTAAGRA